MKTVLVSAEDAAVCRRFGIPVSWRHRTGSDDNVAIPNWAAAIINLGGNVQGASKLGETQLRWLARLGKDRGARREIETMWALVPGERFAKIVRDAIGDGDDFR